MGALVDIKVPDIGDFTDVEVIEVMVKPGDPVRVDDSLITIESDKASMEVPATEAGVVKEIRVKIGDKVSEGSPIVVIETAAAADGKPAAAAAPTPAAKPAQAPALTVVKKPAPATAQPAQAGEAARRRRRSAGGLRERDASVSEPAKSERTRRARCDPNRAERPRPSRV